MYRQSWGHPPRFTVDSEELRRPLDVFGAARASFRPPPDPGIFVSPRRPQEAAACKRAALAEARKGASGGLLSGPKSLNARVPTPTGTGLAAFATGGRL